MNAGEKDEIFLKIKLIYMRDHNIALHQQTINSVGFYNEYSELPIGFDLNSIRNPKFPLKEFSSGLRITISPARSKSDVYINKVGYSVKSFSSAPPAIVNHTARHGFETACTYSDVDIKELDILINNYWDLRIRGSIREDIPNSDPKSPFRDAKNLLKPVIQYFLFHGSGSGLSKHSASFIIDYADPIDHNSWNILTPESSVDYFWDNLVFSVRATKGMPKYYPNNFNKENNLSIAKWTRYHQGKYRGALHIRVR